MSSRVPVTGAAGPPPVRESLAWQRRVPLGPRAELRLEVTSAEGQAAELVLEQLSADGTVSARLAVPARLWPVIAEAAAKVVRMSAERALWEDR